MTTVTFELPVELDVELIEEDGAETDEELADLAREILFSAPAFDGINEEVIARLKVNNIER